MALERDRFFLTNLEHHRAVRVKRLRAGCRGLWGWPGSGTLWPTATAMSRRKDSTVLFSLSVFINTLHMKHFSFLHSDGWLYIYEMFSFIWRQGNQNQLKPSHWRERKQVGVGQPALLPPKFSRVVAGRRAAFAKEHALQLVITPSPAHGCHPRRLQPCRASKALACTLEAVWERTASMCVTLFRLRERELVSENLCEWIAPAFMSALARVLGQPLWSPHPV